MHQPDMQLHDNPDNRDTYTYCRHNSWWEKVLTGYEKPQKKLPLDVAKKYVETYSSSDAVAQNPEERVQMKISRKRDNFKYYQNK